MVAFKKKSPENGDFDFGWSGLILMINIKPITKLVCTDFHMHKYTPIPDVYTILL